MSTLLWVCASFVALAIACEVVRRLPPRLGLALFVATPLLATPLWCRNSSVPLFTLVKVYSACAGAVYVMALRAARGSPGSRLKLLGYLLLAINILEAAFTDAARSSTINGLAGLLVVASQAYPAAISVDRGEGRSSLRYGLGGWWVAAYTLWNFAFVYGDRPASAAFALVCLTAALALSSGRSDRWIEARTFTLALAMIVRTTAPYPPFFVEVPGWHVPAVAAALHAASLALAVVVAARSVLDDRRAGQRRRLLSAIAVRPPAGPASLDRSLP